MKTWELIEQLQGRDPSGEVVLTLSGDGFKYAANFDLSPPAHRRVILETDAEDIGVDTSGLEDEIRALKGMVDDLQSELQRITKALEVYDEESAIQGIMEGSGGAGLFQDLREAIENAAEISTRIYL